LEKLGYDDFFATGGILMIYEVLDQSVFAPELAPAGDISLTVYARPKTKTLADNKDRWAVLVLPGGGYEIIAGKEGEAVALSYFAAGCQAFLLKYSTRPATHPRQLLEVASAVAYIRQNADKYRINPNRIAVIGFSAGGHLAAMLANFWQDEEICEALAVSPEEIKPNAAILSYAVTAPAGHGSIQTYKNFLGLDSGAEVPEKLWLDKSVSLWNPPTFIWATTTDDAVPVENSVLYYSALVKAGVSAELHCYAKGPHAMALADYECAYAEDQASDRVASWQPLSVSWLKSL
jgi:acetyl esterase/lipase